MSGIFDYCTYQESLPCKFLAFNALVFLKKIPLIAVELLVLREVFIVTIAILGNV